MIRPDLRALVRRRAGERCEYCQLPESAIDLAFHMEHIRARQHGGGDDAGNLALACDRCNLHKGPNLTGIDPISGDVVSLFNPRTDAWADHFRWDGPRVIGLTPIGRATAALLQMNAPHRVRLRTLRGAM